MRPMKTHTPYSMIPWLLASASLLGTADATHADAARAAITAQSQQLMSAIEKGDVAAVADLFAPDATLSVPMSPGFISGRERISGFWQAALGGGLKRLILAPLDLEGDGNLRVETGNYQAIGPEQRELGHGQYLLVWVKDAGVWKISRDFAHADAAPVAESGASRSSAAVADRVGLPSGYATRFNVLGETLYDELHGLTTVFANDLAAAAAKTEAAHYPDGSVILMEFAEAQRDGEGQLLRDSRGQPLKGPIMHVDVMRRGAGFGADYGANRAGEWEFASYRADGTPLIPASSTEQCAACHLKAGAQKDFVFRQRSWE